MHTPHTPDTPVSPPSPADAEAPASTLGSLRSQIDEIDTRLLTLLNQRATLAQTVGSIKRTSNIAVFDPEREKQIVARLQASNGGPLRSHSVAALWREIMSACRALESPQRVACLGPAGTFSEQAAIQYFGSGMTPVFCISLDDVFRVTASGGAEYGVVAIENSSEGVISRSLDLLLNTPLHIVGEVSLLVRHNLLRLSSSLHDIAVVYAHPQALAQCQNWLMTHLPNAELCSASSNAEGARLAASNPAWAAIASERAGAEFGLHIVASAIQDDAFNRTRFAVICLPQTQPAPAISGRDCVSLVVSVANRSGAMHDVLVPLKKHGVSMTRLESRPARSGQWEYYFYIDLAGHPSQPNVGAALDELRGLCAFYKLLGSYPLTE